MSTLCPIRATNSLLISMSPFMGERYGGFAPDGAKMGSSLRRSVNISPLRGDERGSRLDHFDFHLRSGRGFTRIEFGRFFDWRPGLTEIWSARLDSFEVFLDAVKDFLHRVGMVDGRAKECAAL